MNNSPVKLNKAIYFTGGFFLIMLIILMIKIIAGYNSLRPVSGKIEKVDLDIGKKSILKIALKDDYHIYYQRYERRFKPPLTSDLKVNSSITFYTFLNPVEKKAAISSLGDQSHFYYYPVFYVNSVKGYLQVVFFYIYVDIVFAILLMLSVVFFMYTTFPLVLQPNMWIRIPLLLLAAVVIWFTY